MIQRGLNRVTLICLAVFVSLSLQAQEKKKILLKSANILEYIKPENPDVQFLKGNVVFEHDNSLLYCDSALLYVNKNAMDAYGHVHVKVSDTTQIYGDKLHYDGDKKMAVMEKDVKLIDNDIILRTDVLNYDIGNKVGYYLQGAVIEDPHNKLVSKHGYYYSDRKEFFFRHDVVVTGNNFKMTSDSLMYNTSTELIQFYDHTHIISDSTHIYCSYGWYNTITDQTKLINRAKMINGSSVLEGDTLYYDRKAAYGQAFRNVLFRDTTENIMLTSQKGYFSQKDSSVLATDSAVFVSWENQDSLFLHGDTLFSRKDTTLGREVEAYFGVRFYRVDLQGVCDSLYYCEKDSLMRMYKNPVLWSDSMQMSADYIEFLVDREQVRELFMKSNAFIVSQYEGTDYNQVKGNQIRGYLINNDLDHLVVNGNSEAVYFIEDDKGAKTGINKSSSANMTLFLVEREVNAIHMQGNPQGTIYPNKELSAAERRLSGFVWYGDIRPKSKHDLYRKTAPVNVGPVIRGEN